MINKSEPAQNLHHSQAWFLAGLAAVFLRALSNLRYPMGVDQAIYSIVGQGLLHGQLPYRDLWDIKPPGIYYIYALIVKSFGPVMWSVGVVDILWLLAISCCIFYFARSYLGAPAAALAMVFNAARHCRIGYNDAAQAENFLMLCVFAAWFLLREGAPSAQLPHEHGGSPPPGIRKSQTPLFSYCFVAGLVLGAAVWLKYNAIVFFPFVLLIPFVDFHAWDRGSSRVRMSISWKDWLVRASFVGAGFVLIVVAVLGHFWVSGAWPAMMKAHFEVLPRYGATGFQFSISYLIRDLRMSQNNLGLWTEVMALLSLVIAWWRRELAALAPIFLMALAGYLCVAIQGRFHFYHFETCHPLFAMFWGYVCVMTWKAFSYVRKLFAKRRWAVAGAMSWVVLASLVFAAVNEDLLRVVQQYEFFADWMKNPELSYKAYYPQLPLEKLYDQLSMIDFLKRDSDQNDEVYVWGMAPLVNFIAKRHSPTRFFYNYPLMSTWGLESWRQELVQTLETKSPRYIIVERNDENPVFTNIEMTSEQYLRLRQFTSLSNLLARRYKPAAHYTDFEVYTLNEKLKPDRTISTPK